MHAEDRPTRRIFQSRLTERYLRYTFPRAFNAAIVVLCTCMWFATLLLTFGVIRIAAVP